MPYANIAKDISFKNFRHMRPIALMSSYAKEKENMTILAKYHRVLL